MPRIKEKQPKKIQIGSRTFDAVNIVFMILISIVFIYPFINVVAMSVSAVGPINEGKVSWLPVGFNVEGYKMVFGQALIWTAYKNTIIYCVIGTVFNLFLTSMIAYALSIPDFILKKPITIFLTITMFFNGGMVPTYLLISQLKMINTLWALVIPGCVSAYNVFIYRSFFKGLSPSLREAAYLDGAGDFTILFKIYLPLSKALLATFGLFAMVGHWNRWFEPALYLKDSAKQPISLFLRNILFNSGGAQGVGFDGATDMINNLLVHPKNIQYACIVATIGPILLVYPFVQKYFTKGIMVGAVKG